jgi:hypothetical protein
VLWLQLCLVLKVRMCKGSESYSAKGTVLGVTKRILVFIRQQYIVQGNSVVAGEWRKLHNEKLNICTHPILCGW